MEPTIMERPVGLEHCCAEIDKTCANAALYRQCRLKPDHLIVPLSAGNGRSTLLEYMADRYKAARVMPFDCGLDDFIEIELDGTLQQLHQAFRDIADAAIYANEYSNIIGMDISAIALHQGETQYTEFLRSCKEICAHACVVFFLHSEPTRNELRLAEMLSETVDRVQMLEPVQLSDESLCELIIRDISAHGITVRAEQSFRTVLTEAFDVLGVTDGVSARRNAAALARMAVLRDGKPYLDVQCLRRLIGSTARLAKGVV